MDKLLGDSNIRISRDDEIRVISVFKQQIVYCAEFILLKFSVFIFVFDQFLPTMSDITGMVRCALRIICIVLTFWENSLSVFVDALKIAKNPRILYSFS